MTRRFPRSARLLPLLLLLLLLSPAGETRAAEPEAHCKVRVILAKEGAGGLDPAIERPLKQYLTKSFGARYQGFDLLDTATLDVTRGKRGEIPLPDGTWLRLTYLGNQGEFIKLSMEMPGVKTLVRIRDGGLFFQAGHKHKGGMMILAISATTTGKTVEIPAHPRPAPRKPHGENHSERKLAP
ncbi:MAG: hypothetical protein ABIK09_12795 [Pseudomonadota bacterium]